MNTKAILMVSYYYDPYMLTATRNYYLSKIFADLGYEVHIITRLESTLHSGIDTRIKLYSIEAWDYRKIAKWLGAKDGITSQIIKNPTLLDKGFHLLLDYPWNKYIGEGGGFYFHRAIALAKRIIELKNIHFLYSSYRPINDHLICSEIKDSFPHVKWIGDFRDVLWWEKSDVHYQQKWLTGMIRKMDLRTAVTVGIAHFWEKIYQLPFYGMYNGLPDEVINHPDHNPEKFVINYNGRIYTQFQRADVFFSVINELIHELPEFKSHVCIKYYGFQTEFWNKWMQEYALGSYSESKFYSPHVEIVKEQSAAAINLLLTWCNDEIQGFIHGKYNEYVLARKPILCIIEGKMDHELADLYHALGNSCIVLNHEEYKMQTREFILDCFRNWQLNHEKIIPASALTFYDWSKRTKIITDYLKMNN